MQNSEIYTSSGNRRHRGFTLIEVMTVVLIIGVLAALAYPQYTRYVTQARRSDGQVALLQTASLLQKYFTTCGEYPIGFGVGNPVYNCVARTLSTTPNSLEQHYVLSIVTVPGPAPNNIPNQGYILTATPRAAPAPPSPQVYDTECAALSINDASQKTTSGTFAATPERCWRR